MVELVSGKEIKCSTKAITHLVLSSGPGDGILHSPGVVGTTVTCGSTTTSTDEVTSTKVLVLRLRLGIVLATIQKTSWSSDRRDVSLEFLWTVRIGSVLVALTPSLDSERSTWEDSSSVAYNSVWHVVELDVLEYQLASTNRLTGPCPRHIDKLLTVGDLRVDNDNRADLEFVGGGTIAHGEGGSTVAN